MDLSMLRDDRPRETAFWACLAALVFLRFALGADLAVDIRYSPHDDSLYVDRALHFLVDGTFGPYDARVLVKYPGMSLWLARVRELGIPYLLSVNALYVAAGAYLLAGLRRCGAGRLVLFGAAALYLLNPMTLGIWWIRVLREPVATGLLVLLVASIAHVHAAVQVSRRAWLHLAVFTAAFTFALFVREEDRLLWLLLALFVALLVWQAARAGTLRTRAWQAFIAVALAAPVAAASLYESSLRAFSERIYGAPILHELGEGEYPRLLAAIRSIRSQKDNRLVMVTQEALGRLRTVAPQFAPVIDRLPPPGPGTFSCRLQGVCSEWANGWMPYWIKDAAFDAGLTPSAPAAQAYFRGVRERIEDACARGALPCAPKGAGLIPPMELRWTRAYLHEGVKLARMTLWPEADVPAAMPALYEAPVDVGREFQAVTMTDRFDTQRQTNVAARSAVPGYVNPLAALRVALASPYQAVAAVLLLAALILLARRAGLADRTPPKPLDLVVVAFGLYSLLRLAALTYIAVFMGGYDPRMVMSTYALGVPLALVFIAETVRLAPAYARRQRAGEMTGPHPIS
jgi:hypothetical protein